MYLPSGEICGLNPLFISRDWSIVGVVEGAAAAGAGVAGFACCASVRALSREASIRKKIAQDSWRRWRIVSLLESRFDQTAYYFCDQRTKPMASPAPTSASAR